MKIIKTKNAPLPVGAYSQGIECNDFVFFAGQLGLDPKTNKFVGDDVASQTKQIMKNIKAVLKAAECSLESVVKVTIFLANMDDFKVVNTIYAETFGDHKPARSAVEVARLPLDAQVEIEIMACKSCRNETKE